jgi:integrase
MGSMRFRARADRLARAGDYAAAQGSRDRTHAANCQGSITRGSARRDVIEWGGKPVGSLKRGLKRAAVLAGIKKPVSPHVLRHSAAVHMAEDDVSMEKIAQFLGHSNVNTTRKIYARFSPSYLKDAAAALEFDDLGSMNRKITSSRRVK